MTPRASLAAGGLALALATTASLPSGAVDCGDSAGPGGTRVACVCGDNVVTDTRLDPNDAVVNERCGEVGLVVAGRAITLDCDGLALRGTIGEDLNGAGVVIETDGNVVQRCAISEFVSGIRANSAVAGNRILSNTVMANHLFGIQLGSSSQDNHVIDNVARNNGEVGIQINSSSRQIHVVGNDVLRNLIAGIRFNSGSQENEVLLNHVAGEGERGIQFGSSAEGNEVASNTVAGGDLGINFNSDALRNTVVRNVITGTLLAGLRLNEGGQKSKIFQNRISDNRGEGIRIEDQATRNRVRGNLVFGNGDDGIEICGVDNIVASNEAGFNGDWDVCAVAGNIGFSNSGEVTFDCPVPPECEPLLPVEPMAE